MASPGVPPSVVDTASRDGFRFFAGGCADARREIGGGDAVACMRVGARDSRLDLHRKNIANSVSSERSNER